MQANELRVGNLVHSEIWITDVIVDLDNINYHEDFIGIPITEQALLEFGFDKYHDYFTININHGLLTEKPSKLRIKHTKYGNWVVENPANRTIYLNAAHEVQNLFYALTKRELQVSIKEEI